MRNKKPKSKVILPIGASFDINVNSTDVIEFDWMINVLGTSGVTSIADLNNSKSDSRFLDNNTFKMSIVFVPAEKVYRVRVIDLNANSNDMYLESINLSFYLFRKDNQKVIFKTILQLVKATDNNSLPTYIMDDTVTTITNVGGNGTGEGTGLHADASDDGVGIRPDKNIFIDIGSLQSLP